MRYIKAGAEFSYLIRNVSWESGSMFAMVLEQPGRPLEWQELPSRKPAKGEILVKVGACGVCRTDLHVVDGELSNPKLPLIPGHEIIGTVESLGPDAGSYRQGMRVGIPWLGRTCGYCSYCEAGRENLCDRSQFMGYTRDGGYATEVVADARYVFRLPAQGNDVADAPLLCAGLIGWRSLKIAGPGQRLGLYGFGAAAHIIAQVARWQGRDVFAFTKPGDAAGQEFAKNLGAIWAGGSDELPPEPLDAAIIFAPVGALVPMALKSIRKGGRVVCAGIHMSDIPSFPYHLLWEEREVVSVANLTRNDGLEFFRIAGEVGIAAHTRAYPLQQANEALSDLRLGLLEGVGVLVP